MTCQPSGTVHYQYFTVGRPIQARINGLQTANTSVRHQALASGVHQALCLFFAEHGGAQAPVQNAFVQVNFPRFKGEAFGDDRSETRISDGATVEVANASRYTAPGTQRDDIPSRHGHSNEKREPYVFQINYTQWKAAATQPALDHDLR